MVANGLRDETRNNAVARVLGENGSSDAPADYEKAIAATGFGAYNVVLLLATVPAGWASAFDTTTAAFLLGSAEYDLELTFFRKGVLVAIVYIGMIVSSFFWGFVAQDAKRKPLFLLGLLADACCNILTSVTDSYHIFLLVKFVTGTIISGPFALLIPYLAEFHSSAHRAKFVAWTGFVYSLGNVVPAVLAFAIIPLPLSFTAFGRIFDSWRIYILLCAIPALLGLVTVSFLPDSPKRLMAIGKPDKALEILKKMYCANTRRAEATFPIKTLTSADTKLTNTKIETRTEALIESWNNFKELLRNPCLGQFLTINLLQFGSMLGFNTMRLWVPHMFIIINNFDYSLWDSSRGKPSMCELMIPGVVPPGVDADPSVNGSVTNIAYVRWRINPAVYVNSTIIALSAVGLSFFVAMHLDTRIKKKIVLLASFLVGTLSAFGANWAQLVPLMLSLCAAVAVASRIAGNIVLAVNANVVPLRLRASATSIVTMVGSLGTVVGNLIFSSLLATECVAAFLWLGSSVLLCVVASMFALRPSSKSLDVEPPEEPERIVTRF